MLSFCLQNVLFALAKLSKLLNKHYLELSRKVQIANIRDRAKLCNNTEQNEYSIYKNVTFNTVI